MQAGTRAPGRIPETCKQEQTSQSADYTVSVKPTSWCPPPREGLQQSRSVGPRGVHRVHLPRVGHER